MNDFKVISEDFSRFNVNEFICVISICCNFMLFDGAGTREVVCKTTVKRGCCIANVGIRNEISKEIRMSNRLISIWYIKKCSNAGQKSSTKLKLF